MSNEGLMLRIANMGTWGNKNYRVLLQRRPVLLASVAICRNLCFRLLTLLGCNKDLRMRMKFVLEWFKTRRVTWDIPALVSEGAANVSFPCRNRAICQGLLWKIVLLVRCNVFLFYAKKSETQNEPTLKHYCSTMLIVSGWMFLSHDLVSNGALTKGDILHL